MGPESIGRARVSVARPKPTVHRLVDGCEMVGCPMPGKRLPFDWLMPERAAYSSGSSHARYAMLCPSSAAIASRTSWSSW